MTSPGQVDVVRVVRQRGEHNVSRKYMDPDALKVMYRLMRNGFTAYLVGGGVRDLLLGCKPKDFDVATNAHPRQIRKLFRNSFLIGRRFRLVHIRFGAKVIETSTFRRLPDAREEPVDDIPVPGEEMAEDGPENRFRDDDNTFGTPEEDAWRRDFTINALFYDIRTFAIIDHVGGLTDLENRVIRAIGNPDERFPEDPVRMVRAVRFAARLGFRIEHETQDAIVRHHALLGLASPPRMLEEIYKLFTYSSGEPAFRLLRKTRLLAVMFPEIDAFLDRAGPETAVFWKHLAGLDQLDQGGTGAPDPSVIFASLFLAPFLENLRTDGRQEDHARHAGIARALFEPAAVRYRMPKRVFYRTIQLLDGQRRFQGTGGRFSRRFVGHEVFGDMLELRRIHLVATGGDLATLDEWVDLLAQARKAEPQDRRGGAPADGPPAERRRRRRRRSPRSDGGGRDARAAGDSPDTAVLLP